MTKHPEREPERGGNGRFHGRNLNRKLTPVATARPRAPTRERKGLDLLHAALSPKTRALPRWLPRTLRWGALLCLMSAHAAADEADSATRDAARGLGLSGVEAYQAGDYDVASNRLEKAYSLINVPSLGLWSARAL